MTQVIIEILLVIVIVSVLALVYVLGSSAKRFSTLEKLSSSLDRLSFLENRLFSIEDRLYSLQERQLLSYNLKTEFYMPQNNEIYNFINSLEIRNEIRLSTEAKQLLILPILEYQRIANASNDPYIERGINMDLELSNWRDSITKIIESMREEPARIDSIVQGRRLYERTSMSVIKAFSKKFCNIPPFCGEK
jgi:hypothetical protein